MPGSADGHACIGEDCPECVTALVRPIPQAACNCVVVPDLVRERYVWVRGSFGDCGHPLTGTPATEKARPIPPGGDDA